MAGHSKWAQIKRQKAVTDGAKSRTFSRFARLITLESKKANGLLTAPALSAVITRAKAANMPKENIERAIAKGTSKDAGSLEQVTYEAYGPSGVAIIVEALTDNKNRTTQEIRHLFAKQDLELASPGSTLWAFTKQNGIYAPNEPLVSVTGADEEKLNTLLDELDNHEDTQDIYTNAAGYENTGD
jgi:YebC/PmpR family DNA-binding regulatory protein